MNLRYKGTMIIPETIANAIDPYRINKFHWVVFLLLLIIRAYRGGPVTYGAKTKHCISANVMILCVLPTTYSSNAFLTPGVSPPGILDRL
jgi:hypothetical protein